MNPLSIYIHWPFCLSKCPYCDFNSQPILEGVDQDAWAKAYALELSYYAGRTKGRPVRSIYFGGGTPSLMNERTVQTIIDMITLLWPVEDDCEITLEANPTSANKNKLIGYKKAGVNRISLGVQSFDDEALTFLGRKHNSQEAKQAIKRVAKIFDRFSFDLIYARASQNLKDWEAEMETALSFNPQHLSLYQLTIEPQTVFYKRAKNETLTSEEELAAKMYERTQEILSGAGLPAYEISNHAYKGQESRHNLTYWNYDDYIGIGPGAHGRFVDEEGRWATIAEIKPAQWLEQVELIGQGTMQSIQIDTETAQQEAFMMGLRLSCGIKKKAWKEKFCMPFDAFLDQNKVEALIQKDLIKNDTQSFRATAQGLQRLNSVLEYLL